MMAEREDTAPFQALSIYCGGIGGDATRAASGGGAAGWNGGGAGGNGCDASTTGGGGGGGATHVATSSIGEITGSNNLFNHTANLILVAGGGGGGAYNSCVAGVGGNLFNYGTRSDGGIFDKYADGSQTIHDGSQGAVGKTGTDADHKRGGSGGQGGGFRAITELTGQDMTYAGFGGSSWGDTTNGTGYNSVSGGATEGGNGKVIISWVTMTMKNLYIVTLALVSILMAGCSSGDDNFASQTPQPTREGNTVTLATTVSFDGATTRALTADGVKTFAVGDQIAVVYVDNSNATVKVESNALTATDIETGGKIAHFTVTLTNPKASSAVTCIYPAAMAKSDGAPNLDALNTQDGTLATCQSADALQVQHQELRRKKRHHQHRHPICCEKRQ